MLTEATVILAIVLVASAVAGGVVVHRRRRRARAIVAACPSIEAEPGGRIRDLAAFTADTDAPRAVRAAALIALGCAWVDEGWPERAARSFQVAYHLEPAYTSAMLLAFACMKVNHERRDDLLQSLVTTWRETGRPDLGVSWPERAMLGTARRGPSARPQGLSSFAKALWALPSGELRRQIDQAAQQPQEWHRPLWNGSIRRDGPGTVPPRSARSPVDPTHESSRR